MALIHPKKDFKCALILNTELWDCRKEVVNAPRDEYFCNKVL